MEPDLHRLLTDRLDEITADVVREVAGRVPGCALPRRGAVFRLVRDALPVYAGAADRAAVLDAFRDLGADQARAGQDVRRLERALRAGARVLVARTATVAARLYPPTAEFVAVMENAFIAEQEIVQAAVDGHRRAARPLVTET